MHKLRNSKPFRRILTVLVVVLIAAGLAGIWHVRNVHKAQHVSGTIPTSKKSKGSTSSSTKSQKTTSSATSPTVAANTDKSANPSTSLTVLETPFGSFVSNHMPGQNGSPTTEQSVCNTTPGASCDIQFTNGNAVNKSLGATTADSNGTAYWSWNINGGTLAPGSWHITAVVKLNGQTKTATDPTPLEVQ